MGFNTIEDFMKYTQGIDINLTTQVYIDYRPDDGIRFEGDPPLYRDPFVADPSYDSVIANFDLIKARSEDIYYNLSPEEDKDLAESEALTRLSKYYHTYGAQGDASDPVAQRKYYTSLAKAQRKEAKGTENPQDVQRLDDNDTLDDWYDDIERDMEDQGESWIEDPVRTAEELKAFDPATDITWTVYPL